MALGTPPWNQLDARHCWHPFTRHSIAPEPLPVVAAKGAWLQLADGRRLLDAISSWWACLHGHGHPRLVRAMAQQADKLDHVLFAGCTHEPAATLAAQLVRHAPTGLSRVFFSDDGSTAVEVALKIAVQCMHRRGEPQRTLFVALDGGYHGDTFGAMSVGDPRPFFMAFSPLLFEVIRIPVDQEALANVLEQHRSRVAALIVEPLVQGAAGMVPVPAAFISAARTLCDAHGVLMIADEVFTGFGRTGTLFGCEQADITPDLMCVAKGLTNGMFPLSATLVSEAIFDSFLGDDPNAMLFHGHTFTANPIGCAVALASLAETIAVDAPSLYRRNGARIEARLRQCLQVPVTNLRRIGGIVAFDLEDPSPGYLSPLGDRLKTAALSEDVLLRPLGNVLYAIPPVCLTEHECDLIAESMARVAQKALGE